MNALTLLTRASFAAAAIGLGFVAHAQTQAPDTKDKTPTAALFEKADANHDGRLDKKEAAALPQVAGRFASLDKDKDGMLTLLELEAGMKS